MPIIDFICLEFYWFIRLTVLKMIFKFMMISFKWFYDLVSHIYQVIFLLKQLKNLSPKIYCFSFRENQPKNNFVTPFCFISFEKKNVFGAWWSQIARRLPGWVFRNSRAWIIELINQALKFRFIEVLTW